VESLAILTAGMTPLSEHANHVHINVIIVTDPSRKIAQCVQQTQLFTYDDTLKEQPAPHSVTVISAIGCQTPQIGPAPLAPLHAASARTAPATATHVLKMPFDSETAFAQSTVLSATKRICSTKTETAPKTSKRLTVQLKTGPCI